MSTFWLATLSTFHFDFVALGQTKKHARAALEVGLLRHAKQYNLMPTWHVDYCSGVCYSKIKVGGVLRDNEGFAYLAPPEVK